MKFLIDTFTNDSYVIEQEFRVTQTMRIMRFRPWLAFTNVASTCELQLTLVDSLDNVITTVTQTVEDIEDAIEADTGEPYELATKHKHGLFSFIPTTPFTLHPGTYRLRMQRIDSFTPDTNDSSSWASWVKSHDDPFVNYYEDEYEFESDLNRPFWFEIFASKVV